MNKLIVEGIGTFVLVLTIGLTVIAPGAGAMAPLAIGGILMVMVYAGGYISGAHYNPAVTLAAWLRGALAARDIPGYVAAQLVGAALAARLVGVWKPAMAAPASLVSVWPVFLIEAVFTFVLAYVILHVATAKQTAGNAYFGLAIGVTVMAGAYAAGPISGAAFNPAVTVGLTLMGLSAIGHLWIFLTAHLAGGALAALVFRLTNPDA